MFDFTPTFNTVKFKAACPGNYAVFQESQVQTFLPFPNKSAVVRENWLSLINQLWENRSWFSVGLKPLTPDSVSGVLPINVSTERLKWRSILNENGGIYITLNRTSCDNVIWAIQKTESFEYHWLHALSMFDVTSFSAILSSIWRHFMLCWYVNWDWQIRCSDKCEKSHYVKHCMCTKPAIHKILSSDWSK